MTKIESGRSMVEMLGVLAIIGVLSIGGIAGYTMAMNRYRANEIVDAASKMSVVAQTKASDTDAAGVTLDELGLSNNIHGATMKATDMKGEVNVTVKSGDTGIAKALGSIAGTTCTAGTACTVIKATTN